jgi:hypothetical protein
MQLIRGTEESTNLSRQAAIVDMLGKLTMRSLPHAGFGDFNRYLIFFADVLKPYGKEPINDQGIDLR